MRKTLGQIAVAIFALAIPVTASAAPLLYSVQSNGNDHLYSIDAASGVATDLGLIAFNDAEGLAFAGSTLYAIGGSTAQLWDITTPPGVLIGGTGARAGVDAGMDYNALTGTMYNIQGTGGASSLYTINLATGAATLVGGSSAFADNLGINGAGAAYALDGIFTDSLYSVNLATGAMTLIGNLGLGNISDQFGTTFVGGTLYALSSSGQLYTVNTTTGAATLLANVTCGAGPCAGWEGLAAPAAPEPATLLLVGTALGALASRRRRQRSA